MATFRSLLLFSRGPGMTPLFSIVGRQLFIPRRTLGTSFLALNRRLNHDFSRDEFSSDSSRNYGGRRVQREYQRQPRQPHRIGRRWESLDFDEDGSLGSKLVPKSWSEGPSQLPEPMELPQGEMTREEIENFRRENRISLLSNENSTPEPLTDFCVFPNFIRDVLTNKYGFEVPMAVQAQGWPIALKGLDLIAIGQTGSGKTLGYLLPAVMHVTRKPPANNGDPSVLVLAPTRELAQQIEKVLYSYLKNAPGRLRSVCLFGGADKGRQLRMLEEGVDVVIATPGRLIDLLEMEAVNLDNVTYLVLDEADRMLDMGFEPQIRKVLGQIRPERQLSMWSATWPEEVQELAQDFLSGASDDKKGQHVHLNIGHVDLQANSNITQRIYLLKPFEKQDRLFGLLRDLQTQELSKILVFAQTKRTVDFLERILHREGHKVDSIHGNKTQSQRNRALNNFRHGRCNILIATDVASRGLDVDDIQHVVNFDFPNTTEDYIHRIGRTGRSGKSGTSHTFFTEDEAELARDLVEVMRKAKQEVPPELEDLANFRAMHTKKQFNRYRAVQKNDGVKRYNRDFVRKPRTSYDQLRDY